MINTCISFTLTKWNINLKNTFSLRISNRFTLTKWNINLVYMIYQHQKEIGFTLTKWNINVNAVGQPVGVIGFTLTKWNINMTHELDSYTPQFVLH